MARAPPTRWADLAQHSTAQRLWLRLPHLLCPRVVPPCARLGGQPQYPPPPVHTFPTWLLPQLRRTKHLDAANARAIFVTHMHGDHCFGVGGMLATVLEARRGTAHQGEPLLLFGPPELQALVLAAVRWGAAQRCSMPAVGLFFSNEGLVKRRHAYHGRV